MPPLITRSQDDQEDDDAMREAADLNSSLARGSVPGLEASLAADVTERMRVACKECSVQCVVWDLAAIPHS